MWELGYYKYINGQWKEAHEVFSKTLVNFKY